MSFKRAKVVMLPTNEKVKDSICLIDNKDLRQIKGSFQEFVAINGELRGEYVFGANSFCNKVNLLQSEVIPQYLYILSDEEIKEGSEFHWFFNVETKVVFKSTIKHPNCKKIIATTDRLIIGNDTGKSLLGTDLNNYLPQPSQQFIEKYISEYNKGRQILEILVEYEEY